MRLGYFTMPLHTIERNPLDTLQEDRDAIILADQLGFYDAFVGEHLTDQAENVTNSFIFLATLISETKQIKLGTGTSNLSQAHPTLVAAHAAMFDHLAKGRFIFGISPYRYYYKQMLTKMKLSKRHVIFKRFAEEDDAARQCGVAAAQRSAAVPQPT